MEPEEIGGVILTILIVVIILLLGTQLFSVMTQGQSGTDESVTRDAGLLEGTDFTRLDTGEGSDETVWETTGYAVNTSGASDSYVQSESGFEIASDGNWTVSVWGYVDAGNVGENMSLASANGRVIITYNGTNSEWQAWYYDEAQRNSYEVSVPTSGDEVGNFTNLQAWANGTHFTIYRNGTQGDIVDITTENITSAPVDSGNWDGRIEELRTFDKALDSTNRTYLVNNGAEEAPNFSPTSRAMFDQPGKSTQLLLYTDTKLTQSNVAFSQGFLEQEQSKGTDYEWRDNGPQVAAVASGDLDGAPVAYASYELYTRDTWLIDTWEDTVGLAALIPILLVLGIIYVYFAKMRNTR